CNVVVNWFHENDLALNKEKSELIIHCNKSDITSCKDLFINIDGHKVNKSDKIKSLGLIKDTCLTWSDHLSMILKRCYASMWTIRSIRNLLHTNHLKILTESLVLSKLYYMVSIWSTANKKLLKNSEKLFKSCVRLVKGGHYTHGDYNDLEWLNVKESSEYTTMCLAYKCHVSL